MLIDIYQGYFILFLILGICITAILVLIRWKRSRLLKGLKSSWSKEDTRFRDFNQISAYHRSASNEKHPSVDKTTSSDLNLHEVYSKIDRCKSRVGQQYLYSLLHSPVFDENVLKEREILISLFQNNIDLRLRTQIELWKLNKHLTYSIPNLIFDWALEPIKYRLFVFILSITPVLLVLLGMYYSGSFYLLLPVSFLANLIVHYKNKPKLRFFMTPFAQIVALSESSKKIENLGGALSLFDLEKAHQKFKSLKLTQFLLTSENHEHNEFSSFVALLLEYIKITFLLEINLLDKCMKIASSFREEIHELYKYIGLIDSCISIASYRQGLDFYCIPQFGQVARIKAEDIVHPLIKDCVANSINTNEKNVLITGSNMSGKTTFIRTVALNAILAQSIHTVCAKSYETCFLNVSSSIGISDDVLLGKSYYLSELESVYNFIERSDESGTVNLFVMDELFKGTNTAERIAAGQAVLGYLGRGDNIVFVSTHDLELSSLLHSSYDLYHFSEEVNNTGLCFDHKIKKGVLKTRNAIKLLSYFGFPEEIIRSANTYLRSAHNHEPTE